MTIRTVSLPRMAHPGWSVIASLLLGSLVVTTARWGPDWPAQEFRSALAHSSGLLMWDDQWYGGHALLGYSVLYPLVSGAVGASITGLIAVAVAAYAAVRLIPTDLPHRWDIGFAVVVAGVLASNLLIGQIPFLLSTAFGLTALVCLERRRAWWTIALSVACGLASPLGGAFLLMSIPAVAVHTGFKRALSLAGAGIAVPVALIFGGAGGPFPCPWSSLVGVAVFCAGLLVSTTAQDRVLRRFAWIYLLAAVAAFVIPNPVGGNITRLGKLIALPLAVYLFVLRPQKRRLWRAAPLLIAAATWFIVPAASAAVHGAGDPSRNASYYQGLLSFLHTQNPTQGRLEIPFTREHWEAAYVAPHYPIARGWERQTDLQYNAVLYSPLSPQAYRSWLDNQAVDLVALPSVPLDYGGQAEATLLRHPPSYLTRVWSDRNWTVWRVRDAVPLASGAARLTHLGPAQVQLTFLRPGSATVRLRWTLMWHTDSRTACVKPSTDNWLQVRSSVPGVVTVNADLNSSVLSRHYDCDLPS